MSQEIGIKYWTVPSTRFLRWILSVPYVLLLIITNQGMLHHVQGRQIKEGHTRFDRTAINHNNDSPSNGHLVQQQPHHHHHHHHHSHHQQQQQQQQQHQPYFGGGGGGIVGIHSIPNIANPHQYTSYEEFQKAMENPFDSNPGTNLTVPMGDTAFLRCKVRNLGERSISWVRRRDWHILTTGKLTYTTDERFQVKHSDGSDEWTLQIKYIQQRDNGTYECQVSTGTGVASYYVHLIVAVPEAFILGNGEYHVEQGSTINLVCVIEKSPKPPAFIFWYHNDRMINFERAPELSIQTEPGTGKTHSRLIIRGAQLTDTGNYSCKPSNAEATSIMVYVSQASGLFTGDQTAAIQHIKTASSSSSLTSSPAFVAFIVSFVLYSFHLPSLFNREGVVSIVFATCLLFSWLYRLLVPLLPHLLSPHLLGVFNTYLIGKRCH